MKLPASLQARVQALRVVSRPPHARGIASSSVSQRAVISSLNSFSGVTASESDDERVVRMLMFGKPGAGKGTLSARLTKKYDILSISTGDLLRQHINEGTEVGKQAEAIIARGELVPDDVMLKVVTSKLDCLQDKHWILDGFPRTLNQGKLLDAHLRKQNTPLTLVVNLNVADEVILNRVSDRWIHMSSGRVYNTSYNPPRIAGIDDLTGEPLTKRPDDNPEIFSRRLEAYYGLTSPLLSYYTSQATAPVSAPVASPCQHPHQVLLHRADKLALRSVTGRTSDEIWPELDYIIMSMFPGLRNRGDDVFSPKSQGFDNVVSAGTLSATVPPPSLK
ncbi:adenylate kinase [Coprinellus micaceus]|uniref:Adenylate kinase n=1 Tax=Coprinellus micaceus TaxID=71717 RepID=A0A4Y7TQA5_COPMI|nr:adenylate kinase [Coprinellus micaceus]